MGVRLSNISADNMITKDVLAKFNCNNAVITSCGKSFSYKELFLLSEKFSGNLDKRSLVFCLAQNEIGPLMGYLTFITNDVVPLMLDSGLHPELLKNLTNTYKPAMVWMPEDYSNIFENSEFVTNLLGYTLLKLNWETTFPLHEDLALLLTTSGSTGSPKLVKLTYQNIYSNAISISKYLGIDDSERPITSLPMHYSFGLSIINSHLINGATILLTNRSLMEKEFWSFLKSEKATSLSGIPYSFEILKKLRFMNMDLPHLKTITQAGGKLNDALNKEFSEYGKSNGKRFFVMYGQTEATARMSYLPPDRSIEKLGSMGIAIPGGEFSLIDDNGAPVNEPDVVGELVYKGKNVSMGYAVCGNDLAKGDENKGVLITGDLAKRDKDGFYYIVGRKKRFIKLYGNRVNLDETERLIKNIVPDVACTGKDDNMKIYVADSSKVSDVRIFVSTKTGINQRAFEVIYIEKIPKNSSGKTIYSQLPSCT